MTHPALTPAPQPTPGRILCWLLGLAIVAAYLAYYGLLISRNTALPYMDQANYVSKVYAIQDAWTTHAWPDALAPRLYLAAEPRQRPPLMMIPAALLGPAVTPQTMAYLWLGLRTAALLAAVALLARLLGHARFVPALLAAILGNEFFLHVQPYQYMMDHMFASFGLLAFVALLWAIMRPGVGTALGAAAATLALVLIKPQAAVFLAPAYAVVFLRGALWLRDIRQHPHRPELRRWLLTGVVWVVLAGVMVLLWLSPYGRAVALQYQQGSQGWWGGGKPTGEMTFCYVGILASPWMVLGLMAVAAANTRWRPAFYLGLVGLVILAVPAWLFVAATRHPGPPLQWFCELIPHVDGFWYVLMTAAGGLLVFLLALSRPLWPWPIALAGVLTLGSWFFFNVVMTYTIDPRILAAVTPVGAAVVLPILCRRTAMATLTTAVAVAIAVAGAGVGLGWWPEPVLRPTDPFTTPRICRAEACAHEVGLLPLARRLKETVPAPVRGPKDEPVYVIMTVNDDYVECGALNLAFRALEPGPRPRILADSAPWGSTRFPLDGLLWQKWFLTKDRHKTIHLEGDAWTSLYALDDLITHQDSPVHGRFAKVFDLPLSPQDDRAAEGPETVTLWRLDGPVPPAEVLAALKFVEPRFRGTPGHGAVLEQIKALEANALEVGALGK